jgi:hypothetical protein
MRYRLLTTVLFISVLVLLAVPRSLRAQEWQPISPEDLALKDNPKSPGDSAMILYREVEENDQKGFLREYVRIKIFKQEGLEFANVRTVPYRPEEESIVVLKGRTIHPDGSITEFSGHTAQESAARSRSSNETVTAFALPEVTVGSIIEYHYTIQANHTAAECDPDNPASNCEFHNSSWPVAQELFQREVHFSFVPREKNSFNIFPYLLPPDKKPVDRMIGRERRLSLDLTDVAPVLTEAFMPPATELRSRVDFMYYTDAPPKPDEFWNDELKKWASGAQHFMDKKDDMQRVVSSTVSPSDSHEAKLRKIYDRVQSLRNQTYEKAETGREKLKANANVEDVLAHGYGNHNELNRLFVAMARAAGLDATLVNVVQRDQNQFHKMVLSMDQFSSELALVRENGKPIYFDPGTPFCPFGMLPWEDTGVTSIIQDKNSARLDDHNTPLPEPSAAAISREASFKLQEDGSLEGTLKVTFTGQEAMDRRLQERQKDDAGRAKDMQQLAAGWLTMPGEIKLQSVNDWKSSNQPLVGVFSVRIPHYAVFEEGSSRLKLMLLAGAYKNPFTAENRASRIYFHYPYDYSDQITISLPAGFTAGQLPQPAAFNNSMGEYSAICSSGNGVVQLKRDFRLKGIFVEAKYYSAVRGYFEHIQQNDDYERVTITSAGK